MKGIITWSYAPYKPFLTDVGDIYICRIVPSEDKIHLEWLEQCGECSVYFRIKEKGEFKLSGRTKKNEFDILGLKTEIDYEFYVEADGRKSRIRLARTGKSVGTVVNYLHPEDDAYSFSGKYLCSPSLVHLPSGRLLTSMDIYAGGYPQNLTLIYSSDDNGETWHYLSELMPCFWGKMFVHKGELYMLSVSTEYGDLLIGKSTDGGRSFSAPIALLRGGNGKNGSEGVHKNPQNMVYHKGRIYGTLEWGSWDNREYGHAAMVMSADENADLMNPDSWSFSYPKKFECFSDELKDLEKPVMTIEGTLITDRDGKLLDVMRFGKRGSVLAYKVNETDPEAELEYHSLITMDTGFSKFMIKYDDVSERYYSIVSRLYDKEKDWARNLLSLKVSKDLINWDNVCDILDYRNMSADKVGFQYVDFEFDEDDIIFLCRTAFNGAHTFHDSNYSTFHRIKNFRSLMKKCNISY